MKKQELVLPGYKVCDYMIVLSLPEDLRNKVTILRNEFNKLFDVPAVPNKPNLLLTSFTQFAMMEDRIINKLNTISMGHYPFKVELKNFGSINVTSKLPIQELVKKIRSGAQALMKLDDENKPYFAMEPHLNIARKLKPWQYEKSWLEYSTKHFTGRFIAEGMLLLKRFKGDKTWQVVRQFTFQNLPVETRQGELF
jgi:hypothetical protein